MQRAGDTHTAPSWDRRGTNIDTRQAGQAHHRQQQRHGMYICNCRTNFKTVKHCWGVPAPCKARTHSGQTCRVSGHVHCVHWASAHLE